MSVPIRLLGFALALGVAFSAAALAGAAIDGEDGQGSVTRMPHDAADREDQTPPQDAGHGRNARESAARGSTGSDERDEGSGGVAGLASAEDGYRLDVERTRLEPGAATPFAFRVLDPEGRVVREGFEPDHERRLHLIVVRRDTATFDHVHPRMAGDGTWSVDLDSRQAGVYRAFADFTIDGEKRTLGADLFVPGDFEPRTYAPAARASFAGLEVALASGELRAGGESTVRFAVTRNGQPFDALEPHLGAGGHLVALREGDLGYLHVHPLEGGDARRHAEGSESAEARVGEIAFGATFPTPGRYRLFLDFKSDGEVRTASFTIEVSR